jgi:hypothetical protein
MEKLSILRAKVGIFSDICKDLGEYFQSGFSDGIPGYGVRDAWLQS